VVKAGSILNFNADEGETIRVPSADNPPGKVGKVGIILHRRGYIRFDVCIVHILPRIIF
jgi:hypothetical protein